MKKINFFLFTAIIAYIPFYRFFQAFLESHTTFSASAEFWLAHWYEPAILFLLLLNFAVWIFTKKRKYLSNDQIVIIALLVFGVVSIFLLSKTIGRGLEGFRFLLLPLAIYLAITFSSLGYYKKRFIKIYLFIAVAMAIWSIAERFFPADYFVRWGILATQDSWYGTQTVVGVKQGVALLGGPNLLGAYLLPAFFLLISKIKRSSLNLSTPKGPLCGFLLSTLVLVAAVLTFSRSALIGLAVALLIMLFYMAGTWRKRLLLTVFILVFGLGMIFIYRNGNREIRDLFTHGASQASHQSSLQISLDEISRRVQNDKMELIFGGGLGSAGPSAMKYGDGIVSESWYLEVVLELGLLGLVLWLFFFWFVLNNLWRKGEKPLFFGSLSILIMTAFLHTLSDNPAVSFTLFTLLAVSIEENKNEAS